MQFPWYHGNMDFPHNLFVIVKLVFVFRSAFIEKAVLLHIIHKKLDFPLVQLYPSQNTFRTQLNEAMLLYPHHHKGKDESELFLAKPILLKWF